MSFQLAKEYHPDVNKNDKGAAKKFTEVSEAYEVNYDVEHNVDLENLIHLFLYSSVTQEFTNVYSSY